MNLSCLPNIERSTKFNPRTMVLDIIVTYRLGSSKISASTKIFNSDGKLEDDELERIYERLTGRLNVGVGKLLIDRFPPKRNFWKREGF